MNSEGLLKLADLLEADAKNKRGVKFDLYTWGHFRTSKVPKNPVTCGTTACAMGLAAISGKFSSDGLRYKKSDERHIYISFRNQIGGIDSAVALFGISNEQAQFLFLPRSYEGGSRRGAAGERRVAKRIRELVAANG